MKANTLRLSVCVCVYVEGLGGWFILFLSSLAASILQVSFMPSKQSVSIPLSLPSTKEERTRAVVVVVGGGKEEAGDGNLLSWHCKDSPPSQPVIYLFIYFMCMCVCVCVCVCVW